MRTTKSFGIYHETYRARPSILLAPSRPRCCSVRGATPSLRVPAEVHVQDAQCTCRIHMCCASCPK